MQPLPLHLLTLTRALQEVTPATLTSHFVNKYEKRSAKISRQHWFYMSLLHITLKLIYLIMIPSNSPNSAFDTFSVLGSFLGGMGNGGSFDMNIFPGSYCY